MGAVDEVVGGGGVVHQPQGLVGGVVQHYVADREDPLLSSQPTQDTFNLDR